MVEKILAALDGSYWSNLAIEAALDLTEKYDCELTGCHVYAAELHRVRFEEMEPGLPEEYQENEKLEHLRGTHESLITDGMELISDSYLAPLAQKAQERGIPVNGLTPEGRNYAVLLEQMQTLHTDLTILGALGHGHVPEACIGSLAERVLTRHTSGDVLLMREPWTFKGRPIVVGVDGSQNSYAALLRAAEIASFFNTEVLAVAVYDPFFHVSVFRTIADALPTEAQQRFNFPAQEKLHDEIIDRGLEKLYREGLEKGNLLTAELNVTIKNEVLAGKVYPQIHHYAQLHNAGLIVIGHWGLHRDPLSMVGSNTANLARITHKNLLVVAPPQKTIDLPQLKTTPRETGLKWTSEAEARLERIPFFARKMARRAIEEKARESGLEIVDADFVQQMSRRMGRE